MRRGLTEEELALLRYSEPVAEEGHEQSVEDRGSPLPTGFHGRLVLGDISW